MSGLTFPITGAFSGGTGASLGPGTIANSHLASMAANTFKGNNTGGAAAPSDLTADQMQAALAFVKKFTGAPSGGTDGDIGFRTDLGVWVQRSGGAWAEISAPSATGEQLYDGTYAAASHTNRSRYVTTWGVWTIGEWFTSDGSKWYPESRLLRLLDPTEPAGSTSASNVVTKTLAFPANMANGCRRITLEQEFTATGTAGTKSPRVWFGASGAGTGGTLVHAPAASATASVHFFPKVILTVEGNAAQHFSANGVTSSGNHGGGGARGTAAINLANAWELALGGSTSAGDTLTCSYSTVEILWPSLKT